MDSFFQSKRNFVFTAIFYTFLWGCAFPLVKICMESFQIPEGDNMSKCLVAGIRFSFAGILALLWCYFKEEGKVRINRKQLKTVIFYGLLATALQYGFTYIGLSRIDGSKGAIYDQLCVFVVVLTSGIFFKSDKLNFNKLLGVVLGFMGVLIINTDGVSFTFDPLGEGFMLLAVLCQTVAYFVAKSTAGSIPAPKLVGYGQLIGGIMLCIYSSLAGGRIHSLNITAVISLIALVLIAVVAYILSLMPLKYFPASQVSSFNLLITVFGVVMSSVMLGENIFKWNYGASLALISAGILLINTQLKKGNG